jgi:hypothetical protein
MVSLASELVATQPQRLTRRCSEQAARPRTWGFGVGVFLLFLIPFQTYLWSLAFAKPDHAELGIAGSVFGFVLCEIPLAVGAVCGILLRWYYPNEPYSDSGHNA